MAPLSTTRVALRPLGTQDYAFVEALELHPERLVSYRHRGTTPSPEAFAQRLWQGVLAQFVVDDVSARRPLGIVAAFGADFANGHVQLAIVSAGERDPIAGMFLEGVELFVTYLFDTFNIHKVFAYVIEPNIHRFDALVGDVLTLEGVLRRHEFFASDWVDVHILAIHREAWSARSGMFSAHGRRDLAAAVTTGDRDAFVEALRQAWAIPMPTTEDAMYLRLREDLGIDSLGFLVLIDMIEGMEPAELSSQALDALVTVGDAFHFFAALGDRRTPAASG